MAFNRTNTTQRERIAMARTGRKQRTIDKRGPLQRVLDRERGPVIEIGAEAAYQDTAPLVNQFAERHGDYEHDSKYGDQRKRLINRGGTPIARWRSAGHLSDGQNAAIDHCIGLWCAIERSGKLVANLDRTVFGCPGDGHSAEIEARDDLQRIKGYFPPKYWSIFESVCRFDEPAGFAGSRLCTVKDEQVATARTVVQFVADVISMKERLSY